MKKRVIEVRIRVERRQLRLALAGLLLACTAVELASETLTLSTTYPSPAGIYNKIITTGDTLLARDAGKVGLRTSAPSNLLSVNGTADVSALAVGVATVSTGKKLTVQGDANVSGTLSATNVQGATYAP